MIKAVLKNYRQSPRKVRLVANALRGKKVSVALINLPFIAKRASLPVKKLIESAIANAKTTYGLEIEDLFIKSITVDAAYTLKRWMPRARGSAYPINKRNSHVTVVLDSKTGVIKKISKKASKAKKGDVVKAKKAPKADTVALPKAPKVSKKGSARDTHSAKNVQVQRTTHK